MDTALRMERGQIRDSHVQFTSIMLLCPPKDQGNMSKNIFLIQFLHVHIHMCGIHKAVL